MKRILILFIALFVASTLLAQPKWSIKATGAIGGSINSGSYSNYYNRDGRDYWHSYDDQENMYENSDVFLEGGVGVRFYVFKWVYLGTDVSYSQFKNKYDPFYIDNWAVNTINKDKTLTLDGISVSVVAGFAYHNRSRFYPFTEVGFMPYFTINDDFHNKDVYFGANFKLGGGVKLTDKFAIELAFSTTTLFKGNREKDYYTDSNGDRYYSKYTAEINSGIGATIGCVFSF